MGTTLGTHGGTQIGTDAGALKRLMDEVLKVCLRRCQDMVNPFTAKIDESARRLAELYEAVQSLATKIDMLSQSGTATQFASHQSTQVGGSTQPSATSRSSGKRQRKSAWDILVEQKVLFESELAKRRDKDTRDRIFSSLRKQGAVVLELKNERVAIEPLFWDEFVNKLSEIRTADEEEVRKILDPLQFTLFQKLRESGLLYFDGINKRWSLTEEIGRYSEET